MPGNSLKSGSNSKGEIFRIGDRVHWFEYSKDMVISNGGYGLIVEITQRPWGIEDLVFLKVLKDGCFDIKEFPITDCDLEDLWEEEGEN